MRVLILTASLAVAVGSPLGSFTVAGEQETSTAYRSLLHAPRGNAAGAANAQDSANSPSRTAYPPLKLADLVPPQQQATAWGKNPYKKIPDSAHRGSVEKAAQDFHRKNTKFPSGSKSGKIEEIVKRRDEIDRWASSESTLDRLDRRTTKTTTTTIVHAVLNASDPEQAELIKESKSWDQLPSSVRFEVKCKETTTGYSVFIVGSLPELGAWNPTKGLELFTSPADFPTWSTGELSVPAGDIQYKFAMQRADRSGKVFWENLEDNRQVAAEPGASMTVQTLWGDEWQEVTLAANMYNV